MIIHTVCFTLHHDDESPEATAFFETARRVLPAVPGVDRFTIARQVGSQSPLRFQFSMEFPDRATYESYNAHPDHIGFVEEFWTRDVAEFTEFDFVPALDLGA
jgi:hypothetical protein